MVNFAFKPFIWNHWKNSSQDANFSLKTDLVCVALSQPRQHELMQAQWFLRIWIQILLRWFSLWFIAKLASKDDKNNKGNGSASWWTINNIGVQYNSAHYSLLCYGIPQGSHPITAAGSSGPFFLILKGKGWYGHRSTGLAHKEILAVPSYPLRTSSAFLIKALGWAMTWRKCSSKHAAFRIICIWSWLCRLSASPFQAYFHWQRFC